jgi:hypothetical protein
MWFRVAVQGTTSALRMLHDDLWRAIVMRDDLADERV